MLGTYWQPREISYSRPQLEWLLPVLDELKEGIYPPDPRDTGYNIDAGIRGSPSGHAPYETAAMIAGEVEARLNQCPDKLREMMLAYYKDGWPLDRLARLTGNADWWIHRNIKRGMRYITGRRRMSCTFSEWYRCGMPDKFRVCFGSCNILRTVSGVTRLKSLRTA